MSGTAQLPDSDLLELAQAGNEQAFVTLYQRRQGAIYRFALHMSGSVSIAEEITQEVFMTLLGASGGYDVARGPLVSYLYGIARRLVWRRLQLDRAELPIPEDASEGERTPEHLIKAPEAERNLMRDETSRALRRAIVALPAAYREAIVLCDLHELSYADAARALGCAVGTVRSRLHRARALLAERLGTKSPSSRGCLV
jgi:RNA polymerase sigma-70 factor (ECF subfamily)